LQLWSIPRGTFGVSFFFLPRYKYNYFFLFGESTHQTAKQKNEKNTQNIMLVKLNKKTTKLIYNILNNDTKLVN